MAFSSLRLRRGLVLLKHRPFSAISSSSSPIHHFVPNSRSPNPHLPSHFMIPSASFRSSSLSFVMSRSNDDEKISPDTILFEGCDYNHWLITMEFPKDPKPTPEEMVETYVQTLAKVVGSVEEAKKRMYACSTTTYVGFQAVMTEEMSEKFRGLPGVVFILPDSYIDPVNKEYGGDKYINGTIIPRPPPVHYGREQRSRNYDRPRYDRQREPMPMLQGNQQYDRQRDPMPMKQGNPPYDRQRDPMPMQQGNPPYDRQRDPMPMQQGNPPYDRQRDPMPMQQGNPPYDRQSPMQGDGRSYSPQQNYSPGGQGDGRGYGPPPGRDYYGQGERRDYGQMSGRDYAQGERKDSMPMGGRDYNTPGGRDGYNTPGGRDGYQLDRRDPMPSYQREYNQGDRGSYVPQERRDFSQVEQRDYGPPVSGDYRQGVGSGYGQSSNGPGYGQRFPPEEQRGGMQGEERGFSPSGQTGDRQGKY